MQCSRFDMRGADAGAGGMSISSGMGASSSSSDASAMAQSTRVFWSGLRLDVPGEEIVTGMERRGLCDGLAELGVAPARKRCHPVVQAWDVLRGGMKHSTT